MMKKILILFLFAFLWQHATSQVLSYSPLYPTVNDTLTVIYDASLGNGALAGVTDVYMYTGVITDESVNLTDWLHQPSSWGSGDTVMRMQNMGGNLHKAKFHIKSFYQLLSSEITKEICFVFSNADGSIAGRNADGSDFFINVFQQGVFARFTSPLQFPLNPAINTTIPVTITGTCKSMINVFHEGNLIAQAYDSVLSTTIPVTQSGKHWFWFTAQNGGQTITDSIYYIVLQPQVVLDAPAGTRDGINYINDTTVILQLLAPNKSFAYLISDLSNWELDPAYMMNKSTDGNRYWIKITGLVPQKEYRFQYLVDNSINIADPYADKVLDRFNDPSINPVIYPNLISYPVGKASQLVSVFQTAQAPFQWTDNAFQKPDNRDLVVYELLVRDFNLMHTYKSVEDSLPYLKRLGINAIELMPVAQYDGNSSWGYMPSFHFAPTKYYGPKNALKSLINACHNNGMAVIFDMVLNHATGQNAMARLYYNKDRQRPAPGNPWFNELIPHPYGYNCDFNHESPYTQAYVDSVLNYWVTEYHGDGYRLDLTKGFTNKVTVTYDANGNIIGTDVGGWGQYDSTRVKNLKRMGTALWTKHPGTFLILEHLADNTEETDLAGFGFMMWSGANGNVQYNQASMGWYTSNSNFEYSVSYKARGWWDHNLMGYMESHDEERLMYNNITYGNMLIQGADTVYSTRRIHTALNRMGEAAALFLTVPGPKMIYEFGERGFDYSINWPSYTDATRTDPKPPRWDYMNDPFRLLLYKKYAAMIKLKENYPLFRTSNYDMNVNSYDKRIRLFDDGIVGSSMSAVALGNFDVANQPVWPEFSHTGEWFDYFTGDSLNIQTGQTAGNNFQLQYNAGEYHIYTDIKLPLPDLYVDTLNHTGINESLLSDYFKSTVYPNPFSSVQSISYSLPSARTVSIKVFDMLGSEIKTLVNEYQMNGKHSIVWNGTSNSGERVKNGCYYYCIKSGVNSCTHKIVYIQE
jgi:hypothetical protein